VARIRRIDDIATADAAFEVAADSLDELFAAAAVAVLSVACDPHSLAPAHRFSFSLLGSTLQDLLYDFLSEVVFIMDTESLLLAEVSVRIDRSAVSLAAELRGERADPSRHDLGVGVKAVTMYRFELTETPDGWLARFVVDL
jgi:SHS2 domain-containing protein